MPTRMKINGRVVTANRSYVERPKLTPASKALPRDREGRPVDLAPIPAQSAQSPYRAGVAVRDSEEGATYRMVKHLDPREGWATTMFWQERWNIAHADVLRLVEVGLLDAAIEEGSQVRRFRCRDEHAVLHHDVYYKAQERQGLRMRRAGKSLVRRLRQK